MLFISMLQHYAGAAPSVGAALATMGARFFSSSSGVGVAGVGALSGVAGVGLAAEAKADPMLLSALGGQESGSASFAAELDGRI